MTKATDWAPDGSRKLGWALVVVAALIALSTYLWINRNGEAQRVADQAQRLLKSSGPQAAEQYLASRLHDDPDDAAALEMLAKLYIGARRYDLAVRPLKHLTQVKPETPGAFGNYADCLRMVGDSRGALEAAEQGLKRDPNDVAALAAAARLCSDGDNGAKELQYKRRITELRPRDAKPLEDYTVSLVGYGRYQEAAPLAEKLLTLAPNDANSWGLRGQIRFRLDRSIVGLTESASDLKKALALAPNAYVHNLFLGRIYLALNRPRDAIENLEKARARLPSRGDADYLLSQAYKLTGQSDLATAAQNRFLAWRKESDQEYELEKRLAVSPSDAEANAALGGIKFNKGDYAAARHYVERALSLRSDCAQALAITARLNAVSPPVETDISEPREGR